MLLAMCLSITQIACENVFNDFFLPILFPNGGVKRAVGKLFFEILERLRRLKMEAERCRWHETKP